MSFLADFYDDYPAENNLRIPNRIAITTRFWGDPSKGFVPKGTSLSKKQRRNGKFLPQDTKDGFAKLLDAGVRFVETSESYGIRSRSAKLCAEQLLAPCIAEANYLDPIVATTYDGSRFRTSPKQVINSLRGSLARLGQRDVGVYLVKAPLFGKDNLAKGLMACIDLGLCRELGGIDMGPRQLKGMIKALRRRGGRLVTNQFEFNMLNRKNLKRIEQCKELGVIPLITNPLGPNNVASGLYTLSNPSGGIEGGPKPFGIRTLQKLSPLHVVQETIAEKCESRASYGQRDLRPLGRGRRGGGRAEVTTTQVALNYIIAKGGVPLVDVYDEESAMDVLGCLGWKLTDGEVEMLDSAIDLVE